MDTGGLAPLREQMMGQFHRKWRLNSILSGRMLLTTVSTIKITWLCGML
jgi:hypothetical protein